MIRQVLAGGLVVAAAAAMEARPAVAFGADTALIMDGTGAPTPAQSYINAVENLYLVPNGYGAYTPQGLTTPEQAYPITGVNSLPVDTSAAQGVTILDGAIRQQIAAGNRVVVFGYSQSSAIASQEAAQLASSSNPPSPNQLSFVLVGDPSNPNGGFNQRFQVPGAPLSLPSLGTTFNNAPAASNTYPTAVYTQAYDGYVDFPQYPINLLSDLNALVGIFTQHFGYADLTPQQISSAVPLPTAGNTTTKYYMIPTPNLPLLAPVRLIPLIGNPLADLLQPDLAVLVNLGYGSISNGWSPGPANVPTPFGLFPTNINPADVLTALANGIPRGVTNALTDLKTPQLFDFSSLSLLLSGLNTHGLTASPTPSLLQLLAGFATLGNAGVPVSSTGGIVNTLTSLVSNDIAVVRPLVDTALAIGASLPKYDAQLFASQLAAGNLLNAVGMPIAADVGLVPYALLVGGLLPIVGAAATTVTQLAQLAHLAPNPASANPASTPPPKVNSTAVKATPQVSAASAPNPASTAPSAAPPQVSSNAVKAAPLLAGSPATNPPQANTVPTPTTTTVTANTGPLASAVTATNPPAVTTTAKPNDPPAVTPTHTTHNRTPSSPKAVPNTDTTPPTSSKHRGTS